MTHHLVERLLVHVKPDEGRIPSFVHADEEVYQLELERLFQRTWLFVAHASELPNPGDFVLRQMGEQSVIVTRDDDGELHVLLNVCTHRGMRLCREDQGHTSFFRCPFHGFSFSTAGELRAVPFQRNAYAEGLDRARLRLVSARVETYRDLVFATWAHDGPTLHEHLGDMTYYLDIMAARGEMEVLGAPQQWVVPTGWKIPAENFASDAYHTATAHSFLAKVGLVKGADFGKEGYHVDPGGGHGLGIGVQDEGPWYPEELRAEYEACLAPPQLELLDRVKNFHGNVFPNLSFLIPNVVVIEGRRVSGTTLRQWQPLGPDRIRVWSWYLVEKKAPEWWKELGRRMHVQTFGISGMLEQDDTEIWEAQSRNARMAQIRGGIELDYTMGLGRPPLEDGIGPGRVYEGKYNDAVSRSFYRRWLDLLTSDRVP